MWRLHPSQIETQIDLTAVGIGIDLAQWVISVTLQGKSLLNRWVAKSERESKRRVTGLLWRGIHRQLPHHIANRIINVALESLIIRGIARTIHQKGKIEE